MPRGRNIETVALSPHIEHSQYRAAGYFPQLDGARAISVLLVIAFHTADLLWRPLNGYLGVTVFFVISGYLITTLLLREEDRHGRVSIRDFYIRRTFRIFPLYYLALAGVTVLVLGLGLGSDPDGFRDRLPLLAAYMGEFAGSGTFSHSWSLGIEEKFYLLWPILAFASLAVRRIRLPLAVGLLALTIVSAPFDHLDYLAIYTPIMAGCCVAILLHREDTYRWFARLGHWIPAGLISVLAVLELLRNNETSYVHVPFSILIALLIPCVMVGSERVRQSLGWGPLRYIGTRAYALYLFHPMVGNVVSRVLPEGGSMPLQVVRLVIIFGLTLAVADLLYRSFEQPLIRLGRRVTRSRRPAGALPPDPA